LIHVVLPEGLPFKQPHNSKLAEYDFSGPEIVSQCYTVKDLRHYSNRKKMLLYLRDEKRAIGDR
jgi:hypothetical protein